MKKNKKAMATPADWNYEQYVCPADITAQRVEREVRRFEMTQRITDYGMPSGSRFGLSMESFIDQATQQMILKLKATIAAKKFDVKTVRFPDGAWQFLKFNLSNSQARGIKAVQWFLKKYPVRFVEITMEANAYHPDISIPDHDTYVNIALQVRRDGRY